MVDINGFLAAIQDSEVKIYPYRRAKVSPLVVLRDVPQRKRKQLRETLAHSVGCAEISNHSCVVILTDDGRVRLALQFSDANLIVGTQVVESAW